MLKKKIALGANYVNTQMFFDNSHFYNYVSQCKQYGIDVPIVPGLKPISSLKQLSIIPRVFSVEIPYELSKAMQQCKSDADLEKVGTEWLLMQCRDLLKNGTKVLHFYTLSKPEMIYNVLKQLF